LAHHPVVFALFYAVSGPPVFRFRVNSGSGVGVREIRHAGLIRQPLTGRGFRRIPRPKDAGIGDMEKKEREENRMSTQTPEAPEAIEMATRPVPEHDWLQKLVGEWRVESEMTMAPGQPKQKSTGTESVKSLGGLWASGEGKATMPDGTTAMTYCTALGYDVSFKEYRGCWFASMSSHLWKQTGELSADGRVMTLHCVGPHMTRDGETANYRDVIEILDEDHRTLTSYGQDDDGEWHEFMKAHYTRV
jgi:hypothetical protein